MSEDIREEGTVETPTEEGTDKTPEEAKTSEKTQTEAEGLSKEQKSKLEAFDRIYAEKKSLEEKVKVLEEEMEKIKPSSKAEEGKQNEEEVEEWSAPTDPIEIVRLGKVLNGYSEEEIEFIMRNAPTRDVEGIIGATKDPWVQAAIKAQREKVAKENKTPEPSSPTHTPFPTEEDASKAVKEGRVAQVVAEKMKKLSAEKLGEGI